MSTLTRRQSGGKLPDYKDYVNFVSAYRNGKKEAIPSDDSKSKTPSPEPAMAQDKNCESYSDFLEKCRRTKFGSVKPPIPSRDAVDSLTVPAKKTVKTEIFLEINAPTETDSNSIRKTVKKFENQNGSTVQLVRTRSSAGVEAARKIFENDSTTKNHVRATSAINRSSAQIPIRQCKNSVHSKTESDGNNDNIDDLQKIPNEKLFDQRIVGFQLSINDPSPESSPNLQNQITPLHNQNKNVKNEKCVQFEIESSGIENFIEQNEGSQDSNLDVKDKLIEQLGTTLYKTSSREINESETNEEKIKIGVCPPPPPPMPNYVNTTKTSSHQSTDKIKKTIPEQHNNVRYSLHPNNSPLKRNNMNVNRTQKYEPGNERSELKSGKMSTLERTDPLVRKLAYGAMLDMYGAYHGKANSYVATLPRNQVKKGNGLQKIIDNIAAQGGLEKLSGRSNPKIENE